MSMAAGFRRLSRLLTNPVFQIEHLRLLETMSQTNTPVPDYLIELWNLNLDHQPNIYSPLIIPLLRSSIVFQRQLSNRQHFQILRKLTDIAGSPNVTIFLKLEILKYLRHIAIKYFTVEYQNDILKSIRQLFHKSFTDSDVIVKRTAFIVYARVIIEAQHDILPDSIAGDESMKMELFNFIKKTKNEAKSRAEQIKFLHELSSYSIRHERAAPTTVSSAEDDDHLQVNEVRMGEIISRMQSDTKELMELNRKHELTKEFCANIASIRQELSLLK